MAKVNDLVLIYVQDEPQVFARIEEIKPANKKDWYNVNLLILADVPPKKVVWTLKKEYINGTEFTMNGERMRLKELSTSFATSAITPEDKKENVLTEHEKVIIKNLKKLLMPLDKKIKHNTFIINSLLWISLICTPIIFSVFFDFSWWIIILLTLVSTGLIAAIFGMIITIFNKIFFNSTLIEFIKIFPPTSPDYIFAFKQLDNLKEFTSAKTKLISLISAFDSKINFKSNEEEKESEPFHEKDSQKLKQNNIIALEEIDKTISSIDEIGSGFMLIFTIIPLIALYMFGFTWWKLIILGALVLILLVISSQLISELMVKPYFFNLSKRFFLSLFPYDHCDQAAVIKNFKEQKANFKELNIHKLTKLIVQGAPDRYSAKKDEKYIKEEVVRIVAFLDNKLEKFSLSIGLFSIFISLIILISFFLFTAMSTWKVLLFGLLSSFSLLLFALMISLFFKRSFIYSAKKSFSSIFPAEHLHHILALKEIKKLKEEFQIADKLLKTISPYQSEFDYNYKDFEEERKIEIALFKLIAPYDNLLKIGAIFLAISMYFVIILFILYFFVFSSFPLWKAFLFFLCASFLYNKIATVTIFVSYMLIKRSLLKSYKKLFSENSPNYYTAISKIIAMNSEYAGLNPHTFKLTRRLLDKSNSYLESCGIILNSFYNKYSKLGSYFIEKEENWKKAYKSIQNSIEFIEGLINKGYDNYEVYSNLSAGYANLGLALLSKGDLSEALKKLEKAKKILKKYSKDHKNINSSTGLFHIQALIGLCYGKMGDLRIEKQELEDVIEEYESIIRETPIWKRIFMNSEVESSLINQYVNIGIHSFWLNDIGAAKEYFKKAKKMLDSLYSLTKKARINKREKLALVYMNLGLCFDSTDKEADPKAALTEYSKSRKIVEQLYKKGHTKYRKQLAMIKLNIGNCYLNLKQYALAKEMFKESMEEYEKLIKEGHDDLLFTHSGAKLNFANCLKEIGDYSGAEKMYQEAFKGFQGCYEKKMLEPNIINRAYGLTSWYSSSKRPGGEDFTKVFKIAEARLDWLDFILKRVTDTSKADWLKRSFRLYWESSDLAIKTGQYEKAYIILERSKARILTELMIRQQIQPRKHIYKLDENSRKKYENLCKKYKELNEKLHRMNLHRSDHYSKNFSGEYFQFEDNIIRDISLMDKEELNKQYNKIERELSDVRSQIIEKDPDFGEAIQPPLLQPKEILSFIPENCLVIAFEQQQDFLRIYPITSRSIHQPIEISELNLDGVEKKIDDFTKKISKKNSKKQHVKDVPLFKNLCKWMDSNLSIYFSQLIERHNPKTLIIIPHMQWHLVPIHLVKIDNEHLGLRYPLRYLPSLQILRLILQRNSAKYGKGCIVASHGDKKDSKLIGAEQEGNLVNNMRKSIDENIFLEKATLENARRSLNDSQHVHFACHAYYKPNLNSGLTMNDGNLIARELFSEIKLDNPRLVVMSACETAKIHPTINDEYMGLTSGFLFAGAHNVLATLWHVNDYATYFFVKFFYSAINDGLPLLSALQQAQHKLRMVDQEEVKEKFNDGKPVFGKKPFERPYFWAGFVLIGDGE
jgi:CHAT domain-containing protein